MSAQFKCCRPRVFRPLFTCARCALAQGKGPKSQSTITTTTNHPTTIAQPPQQTTQPPQQTLNTHAPWPPRHTGHLLSANANPTLAPDGAVPSCGAGATRILSVRAQGSCKDGWKSGTGRGGWRIAHVGVAGSQTECSTRHGPHPTPARTMSTVYTLSITRAHPEYTVFAQCFPCALQHRARNPCIAGHVDGDPGDCGLSTAGASDTCVCARHPRVCVCVRYESCAAAVAVQSRADLCNSKLE